MTDYTPTTEEVRQLVHEEGTAATTYMTAEDFDRWLAKVKADAFVQGRDSQRDYAEHVERERIIKLLEASIEDDEDQYRLGWAIALIKGEEQ